MRNKTVSALMIVAVTAFGGAQLAHAQKNYTDGGDLYGGAHTNKGDPNKNAAKSGKFDPYTDGAKKSTKSNLSADGAKKKADPYTDGAKSGKPDPYTDGAKSGKFDPYTDGAKAAPKQ